MNIKRVLSITGECDAWGAAARAGTELARQLGAIATLANTVQVPFRGLGRPGGVSPSSVAHRIGRGRIEELQDELDRLASSLRNDVTEGIRTVVLVGRPVEELTNFARQQEIDLIVAPRRKSTLLHQLLCRHVGERLSWHSTCPVLLMPPLDPGGAIHFRRMLVAVDGVQPAQGILQAAESVAAAACTLDVVHVWTPREAHEAEVQERERASKEIALKGYVAGIVGDETTVAARVVIDDDPARHILEEAARSEADAIVVGSHPRSGLGETLFGTIADQIIERAEVPVLAVSQASIH